MNKKILFLMILACTLIFGCSSGGSSKPVSVVSGPTVTSIFPASGGPGTLVTISGSNFGLVQSTSIVSYAGVTVVPITWSDNQISLKVPDSAPNNGNFVVVVNGVYSNASMVFNLSNPSISSISPSPAAIGSEVTISGQYFGSFNTGCYVTFNSSTAAIKNWNNNSITCTVPDFSSSNSGAVSVVVWLDASRYSNSYSFNLAAPTINNVSPSIDNIGARVIITGQAFGQNQGTITVGGYTAQIVSWLDTRVEFRVPQVNSAGWKTLTLTAGGRQVNNSFTVAAPEITSPQSSFTDVGNGDVVSISGNHFGSSDDQVTKSLQLIDESNKYYTPIITSWSDTGITFTWPVPDKLWASQLVYINISVGGLTNQSYSVTAD
ncbi:MAG: hypothetical protein CVV41_07750 [Candidatus Riflebacteria bacterium HGW-Riflebacteria-1]|jgi:hypothetical protein|nr:MAG: hypothetical protein CVV41_07750 [Candidatus Riflebacteria bacterium HGW-Riflebacteria-1]